MPECDPISEEISRLRDQRASLWEDLRADSEGEAGHLKWAVMAEIAATNRAIAEKEQELNACLAEHGIRQALLTTFNCTATLTTTHPFAPGPFETIMALGVWFDPARSQLRIVNFPPVAVGPFPTPAGNNITTISLVSGGVGTFSSATGEISTAITLLFDHSAELPIPFYEEDSTLRLLLGSGSAGTLVGAPYDETTRRATLVGTGVFAGGILGGARGDLVAAGTFAHAI